MKDIGKKEHIEVEEVDDHLLEKLQRGDVACFSALYDKYSGKIYNYILKISGGDFYLAEEIVQNVFVKIWEVRMQIRLGGSFNALIYTMARNMFLNVVKSRIQESLYIEAQMDRDIALDSSVEKEVEFRMLEEQVAKLMEQLPPARRQIYTLSRVKHLSNKEIAAMLHLSENTVESQLNKAVRYIRKNLLSYAMVASALFFLMY